MIGALGSKRHQVIVDTYLFRMVSPGAGRGIAVMWPLGRRFGAFHSQIHGHLVALCTITWRAPDEVDRIIL